MNKRPSPTDLLSGVTAAAPPDHMAGEMSRKRETIVNAITDFKVQVHGTDPDVAEQRAEQLIEQTIAAGKLKLPDNSVHEQPDFDWLTSQDVVLHEQPETAIYFNPNGGLVIRQRADWNEENDPFVYICPNNIDDFIDKLCDVVGIGSAGKR